MKTEIPGLQLAMRQVPMWPRIGNDHPTDSPKIAAAFS